MSLAFKGERTYLHSTDIFDALIAQTKVSRNLHLNIKHSLTHQIEAMDAADCDDPNAYPARFSGEGPNGSLDIVMRETDREVAARVPYDEDAVIRDSRIEKSSIHGRYQSTGTLIERLVALNKRLISDTVKPGKKLMFTSISLSELLPHDAPLTLTLESRLGTKLFRSGIHFEQERIGEIVFYGV